MRKLTVVFVAIAILMSVPLSSAPKNIFGKQSIDLWKTPLNQVKNYYHNNGNRFPQQPMSVQRTLKHTGLQQVLVLLMKFPDVKPTLVSQTIAEKFNHPTLRSLKNYYEVSSWGKYSIDFGPLGIKDWIMMPKPYAQYQTMEELVEDGVKVAESEGYNLKDYDEDGNNFPDLTIFVWAGVSWALGGDMPGDFTMPYDKGLVISVAEDTRFGYSFPLITIIHEYFHGMGGLWDLYDYAYIMDPVGGWDLMAGGVWDNFCGLSSFHRWKADWLELETITEPGIYQVDDLNGDGKHKAYRVPLPGSKDEWILIENRRKHGGDGYFSGCPNEGMVMYHVDDRREYKHLFNTYTREFRTPGIAVIDPSGTYLHKNAVFGKDIGNKIISATTMPSTLPYVKNDSLKTLVIKDISVTGPTMTFTLDYDVVRSPVINVIDTLGFGKVEKGKTATMELVFGNSGIGKLQVFLKPENEARWVSLDRVSFVGNDEPIYITIDTKNLNYGINKAKVLYNGNINSGFVNIIVDVISEIGDINMDSVVDEKDMEEFYKAFGKRDFEPGYSKKADFNGDGVVDSQDLLMMAKNFTQKS